MATVCERRAGAAQPAGQPGPPAHAGAAAAQHGGGVCVQSVRLHAIELLA